MQKHNWRAVWNDPATKVEISKELDDALSAYDSLLVETAGGQYFTGISVLIGKPEPVNKDLAEAAASEQTKVAEAQAAEAQAEADVAKAEAQTAVAQAEAEKKRAEIDGFGGIEAYLKWTAVQEGLNPWQPTYVYPGAPAKN